MRDVQNSSDKDAVVAGVLMKATELVRAMRADLVKVSVMNQIDSGDPHIYLENAGGRVIEIRVQEKLSDGRQFIDCETYSSRGNDYDQWSASSPEDFYGVMDENISGLSLDNGASVVG